MKATLIKEAGGYDLYRIDEDGKRVTFASTQDYKQKLSLKNCQAIERGWDLIEEMCKLVDKKAEQSNTIDLNAYGQGCLDAFQKALELMGDKKFSEEDLMEAYSRGQTNSPIQSLQQTEWDVEVEMEYVGECNGNNDNGCFQDSPGHNCGCFERKPKLDADGCLILKTFKSE